MRRNSVADSFSGAYGITRQTINLLIDIRLHQVEDAALRKFIRLCADAVMHIPVRIKDAGEWIITMLLHSLNADSGLTTFFGQQIKSRLTKYPITL